MKHSPRIVRQRYPDIGLVVDISHDEPPYRTDGEQIPYRKAPTTSKIPPTRDEVKHFISIAKEFFAQHPVDQRLAVHCHYGFNRTGFMICCFMIEELGVPVNTAIERWAISRPPGLKHAHFRDELFLRWVLWCGYLNSLV